MDDDFLLKAAGLARQAIGLSEPNPRVGCVLVSPSGEVLGQGHTQQAGGPHAEVMALRDAESRGLSVAGATAYVTLEPCAHHGRTPPCADALVRVGVGRVVIALMDPNPLVGGKGAARLREAGIQVDVVPPTHPAAVASWELNIGFLSRMVRQRPWVRMKMAGSLDGRTALSNGQSKWITGEVARADGQAWRARAGAVLTGIGTVLADDPRLDVRAIDTFRQPLRVVLDAHWRTPVNARIWDLPGEALVIGLVGSPEDEAAQARYDALVAAGRTVLVLPADESGRQVSLPAVLAELTRRHVNELHVEAGAQLNAALMAADLVDEYLLYQAPKLIGPGRALAELPALADLAQAVTLQFHDVQMVGDDLRILARPPGRGRF
ncbi:MAG TPA: bifunctional diaminohydroxyphosphoribosylaminopyrimidine deaminase/5-amino-6-(5-phosphoribosylamino)uracil reductase RibD [Aquabacterium sp.]|uniref:bifunctional diaminohydroxyphosphoribosylaminopyrimidine deaminase/5-amino-6-(5-phosphoribosylamino)uracil reductase RibD n=1 Tax=Aquabacterium sp. TaxID=1872578 RepID=UPI002E33E758|nr:bifunctional diaminohydroxyphosphoribosylaminopyrimidine deaminase/5-amino-6-(5-phosphoribosylamino)uracil reductase RibD [Aquabacterium sp.]HEX5357720.1 bifunctional diaminohydroxyphosphoribosylaminopyrimidine deaminase/5-amino-6-(5-phosphoribosylamino)uracil reductase RibD [Aquabacterium sp.]